MLPIAKQAVAIDADYCIKMGWVKPPEPKAAPVEPKAAPEPKLKARYTDEYKAKLKVWKAQRRKRYIAAGLTGEGKPRKYRVYAPRQPRKHLSQDEFRKRNAEYQRRFKQRVKQEQR